MNQYESYSFQGEDIWKGMMGLSTFERRFKKEFGESPHKFLHRKKLEKAMELIENTSLPLSVISRECGFQEYSNFSVAFKKVYQTSPREFR